jgi:hypothetical protein
MFFTPEFVFGGTNGVGSRFHVLHSPTRFRQFRGRRVPFSVPRVSFSFRGRRVRFSFSAVAGASGPVFLFCAPELFFGSSEDVGARFHALRAQIYFRRYRVRRVTFSFFACPDSFSAVPRASCPVFMFFAPGLVLGSTEGVGSRFHVLRTRTHFRQYRQRRVSFLCYVLPDSFSAVPSVSGPF